MGGACGTARHRERRGDVRPGSLMPLAIDATDIHRLDARACADVMNGLLRAEARRAQVAPRHVCATLQVNTPDEKVDAAVTDPTCPGAAWLPAGECVWQFRSGQLKPGGVRECLHSAGRVVCQVVASWRGRGRGHGYLVRQVTGLPVKRSQALAPPPP